MMVASIVLFFKVSGQNRMHLIVNLPSSYIFLSSYVPLKVMFTFIHQIYFSQVLCYRLVQYHACYFESSIYLSPLSKTRAI